MEPGHPAYDTDWIFSNNSDVHVANHTDWFIKYTPFNTRFDTGFGDSSCNVEGIGDVELTVKTHPSKTGAQYQRTLVLQDVLHAPNALCNILGGPILKTHNIQFGSRSSVTKLFDKQSGACMGLIDLNTLYRLRLRGQRSNQTSLDPDGAHFIRANWPARERALWEQSKSQQKHPSAAHSHEATCVNSAGPVAPVLPPAVLLQRKGANPPLTSSEKKWLKDNFGDEFHFLRDYGLSIYKDEDREEGRSMIRAFIRGNDEEEEEDDGSENSFLRELEEDPTSHAADYHFSSQELDWIKKGFGHSGNFLRCYALKFYDDEDCREGQSIVRAFMEGSEDKEPAMTSVPSMSV